MLDRLRWPLLAALLTAALVLIGGCSDDDDDDNPVDPGGPAAPEFGDDFAAPQLPQGLLDSNDPQAAQVVTWVNQVAQISNHLTYFDPPQDAAKDDGPPWVYEWTYQGGDASWLIRMVVDEDDTMWTWDMHWTMTQGGETVEYLVYHAWEHKDGSGGGLEYYDDAGDVIASWVWNQDGGTEYRFTTFADGAATFEILVAVNTDGSGSVRYYADGDDTTGWLFYAMDWDAIGNGSWIQYGLEGDEIASGSWSVTTAARR